MASILKLLQTLDPKSRQYIRYYRISEIYESLISGLAIVRPDDSINWLIEKLEHLHVANATELRWDLFVPEEIKPPQKPVDELSFSYIFSILDEMLEPTAEMIERAYTHYNEMLHRKVFYSLRKYYFIKTIERKRIENHMKISITHHTNKLNGLLFSKWLEWVRNRKDRQAIAFSKISRTLIISHMRIILNQWHTASREARKTREYFETQRLERGDAVDEGDLLYYNGEARDDMSLLPRSAAIRIFSFLSIVDLYRCAQVCRSWKMLTNSSLLWSKLDLYPIREKLNDKLLTSMIQKCRPFLIHLNVRCGSRLTANAFVTISGCHNIQDLNISECKNLTDDLVNTITIGCHVLRYLNISFNDNLTDSTLRCLSKNCKNLQYLSVAFCSKLTDKGFATCGGLKELIFIDLSGCINVTPNGYQSLSSYCQKIETLVINNFTYLSDRHLKLCSTYFNQLSEVIILDSPHLTDDSFRYLSQSRLLKKLQISSNRNLTDHSIKILTRNCGDLRHVSITDCEKIGDGALKCLANCKNLSILNMADCIRITDIGIKFLTEGICVTKLRELNLTNLICIGNQSMIALARKCKSIAYLTLSYCEQIEEDAIELVGSIDTLISIDLSGCNCGDNSLKGIVSNNLKHCIFADCKEITDLGLQKFCSQCPNLESLDLSNCSQVTDNSIKSLAFCCKFLVNLNLSGCTMVTDMSIQYLSGVCAYLQVLDLSKCHLISDKSLKYLRKGCKFMQKLVILHCSGISKDAIEKMRGKIPLIEHFTLSSLSFSNL